MAHLRERATPIIPILQATRLCFPATSAKAGAIEWRLTSCQFDIIVKDVGFSLSEKQVYHVLHTCNV